MRRRHLLILLPLVILSGLTAYSLVPHCPLSKYGLQYRTEGAESPSWKFIVFYIEDNPSKIECPWFDGSGLNLQFKDCDGDGVEEIIVTNDHDPAARSVVKAIIKDGKVTGFRELENHGIGTYFNYHTGNPDDTRQTAKRT